MTEFARLGLEIDSSSAEKAIKSLDNLVEASQRAEAAAGGVKQQTSEAAAATESASQKTEQHSQAQDKNASSTRKVTGEVGRYIDSLRDLVRNALPGAIGGGGMFNNVITMVAGSLMSAGGAIPFVTAGLGALAAAWLQAEKEVLQFNNAILLTNNYSGTTYDKMLQLARQIEATGNMTVGQSKAMVAALVNSGQITSGAFNSVAGVVDRLAATGRTADQIVRLFADPAKGAEELNRQMHLLTPQEVDRIQRLGRLNELTEAQNLLAERLNQHLPAAESQLGTLERAWSAVRRAASSAWDAMLDVGRPDSLSQQIKETEDKLALALRSRSRFNQRQGPNADQLRLDLEALRAQQISAEQEAQRQSGVAQGRQKNEGILKIIDEHSSLSSIERLEDRLRQVRSFEATSDEERAKQANAIHQLEKQIAETRRSAGENERRDQMERLRQENRLLDQATTYANQQVESEFKLHRITEAERDRQKYANDLALLQARERTNEELQRIATLDPKERARLQGELVIIRMQTAARQTEYEYTRMIAAERMRMLQFESDMKRSGDITGGQMDERSRLRDEIRDIERRNAELGKTRQEIEALRLAELDREIQRREFAINQESEQGGDPDWIRREQEAVGLLRTRREGVASGGVNAEADAEMEATIRRIRAEREAGLLTHSEYDDEEASARARHEARITGVLSRAAQERLRFQKMTLGQQTAHMIEMFAQMSAGAANSSKTMFEVNKALSIANAVIKGYEAVQSAYAYGNLMGGPAVGTAFAALAFAFQAANVAAIANTQFGGGGGAGPSGGVAAAAPAPAAAPLVEERQRQITNIIQVNGTEDEVALVRKIANALNEQQSAGVFLVDSSR